MSDSVNASLERDDSVQPSDILEGLGSANRSLLAVCLALFEDSTLSNRLSQIGSDIGQWIGKKIGSTDLQRTLSSVETRTRSWFRSKRSDEELRLVLWIYLREAFHLPARLSVSVRGGEVLSIELAAAAIHATEPKGVVRFRKQTLERLGVREAAPRPTTLKDIVVPVLRELMEIALNEGEGQMDRAAQEKLIDEARSRLQSMGEKDKERLLESVGANELNDSAIRKILLTGGGLTAFGAGVGMAGFSAYILAAQASAFIPLVSGPALVSTVAVVSNPVTVVAATGVALWWFGTSAIDEVRSAIALRVVSLLALQGLNADRTGMRDALKSFERAERLRSIGALGKDLAARYREEWRLVRPAVVDRQSVMDERVFEAMNRPALGGVSNSKQLRMLLFPDAREITNTAVVAGLTLGDIAYSAAAIDPNVIRAADFSHSEAIGDSLDFADFASRIHALSPAAFGGAANNMKGYVAERFVAAELVAKGHQVSFPDSAWEPGWDLLVDGQKFQVKCLSDVSGLSEHFSKYDFPVLANAELAEQVPEKWADRVFFVEGYSDELVSNVTERSLDAGADLLDPNVPVFALGVSMARNLLAYQAGNVTGTQAVELIILDGASRAGLAVLGGYAGKGVGLLVFGPAGALVLGTIVPILSQAQTRGVTKVFDKLVRTDAYKTWEVATGRAIDRLTKRLNVILEEKLEQLRRKYGMLGESGIGAYARWRLVDDKTFLRERRARLEQIRGGSDSTVEERAIQMFRWLAVGGVHPATHQKELRALQKELAKRPTLPGRLVDLSTEAVEQGKRGLGNALDFVQVSWERMMEGKGKSRKRAAKKK